MTLDLPGAVAPPDGSPDQGVPWHFGDPFAEQRAAARKVAIVDRSHRELIAVTGEERLSWLHLVISQHVSELPEDTGTEALVLDSQGRVDAHMVARATSATPSGSTPTRARSPRARAAGRCRCWSTSSRWSSGPRWPRVTRPPSAPCCRSSARTTPELLTAAGLPLPDDAYGVATGSDVVVRRMPWPGALAADLLVPRAELAGWWARLTEAGARPMGSWGFEALRVEAAAAAGRRGHRRPHDPARGRLGARRRARGQGLLPRAGDRVARCTTWAGRRAGCCCCTWTARRRCCRRPATRCCSASGPWAGSARSRGTTSWARSRWRW